MANYVNVGVKDTSTNVDIPTKKALKERIAAYPATVWFYGTSDFGPFQGDYRDLVEGTRYSVTGPDPYNNRRWYATVEKLPNGTIKVS